MGAPTRTSGLTYDELQDLRPEGDMRVWEIIGGELVVTPAPRIRHQRVAQRIARRLDEYADAYGGCVVISPADVLFTEADVLEPDVLFVRADHLDRVEERYVRGAPDLVVEVSSPSTRRRDVGIKRDVYAREGVPEYWFVDLDAERIEVRRLDVVGYGDPVLIGRGERLTTPVLPGLDLDVDDLLVGDPQR